MKESASKMAIPVYQVDAFTDEAFKGNPAAVCLLPHKLDDDIMQNIAGEMNLSETAFLSPIEVKPLKESSDFILRWFTPKMEVPLCGHATLATSTVLFDEVGVNTDEINYETKSGMLRAKRLEEGILLDFPANVPEPVEPPEELLEAVGIPNFENVAFAKKTMKLLVHVESEEVVRALSPNFELMKCVENEDEIRGVIVTSLGIPPYDFVSRFFAPWVGINEDPVTGAAHTVLTPYWSKVLGKKEMTAFQASPRGGKLKVQMDSNNRVNLIGDAVVLLKGELFV